MKKEVRSTPRKTPDGSPSSGSVCQTWVEFWFRPIDPAGLHAIRVLSGILFLAWLLPFAGQLEALFGLEGWFDQQAYREAAGLPEEVRPQFGWSILYMFGASATLLRLAYGASLIVLVLFTFGIATRLTSALTWIVVVSFTANPATRYDADSLLVILAFYLLVGYLLLETSRFNETALARWLGGRENWIFLRGPSSRLDPRRSASIAANVAVRLLQVHWAIVFVTSGLHKLQFGDWWAGVSFWYPLHPPLTATVQDALWHVDHAIPLLFALSSAAYATLCWQITFPAFAWKSGWRKLLLLGGGVCWLGNALLYQLPLFGPAMFIGCLCFLSPAGWQRGFDWLARFRVGPASGQTGSTV